MNTKHVFPVFLVLLGGCVSAPAPDALSSTWFPFTPVAPPSSR